MEAVIVNVTLVKLDTTNLDLTNVYRTAPLGMQLLMEFVLLVKAHVKLVLLQLILVTAVRLDIICIRINVCQLVPLKLF